MKQKEIERNSALVNVMPNTQATRNPPHQTLEKIEDESLAPLKLEGVKVEEPTHPQTASAQIHEVPIPKEAVSPTDQGAEQLS